MKFFSQLLAASLLLILIACKQGNESGRGKAANALELNKTAFDKEDFNAAADTSIVNNNSPVTISNKTPAKIDWDKKIIRTASIVVETKNYKTYNESLRAAVKNLGGYIANEQQNQSTYKIENIVSIKVPVDQFENAVNALTPDSERTMERKITSDDVTTEIVDTKSRIEAKKKVRDRYIDLLKQAKKMEEILQVQKEINGMQEEIESATGRVDYLGHSAAYSTINLTYYQVLNAAAATDVEPSYGQKIVDAFKAGLSWFGSVLLAITSLWPLVAMILLVIVIVKRYKPSTVRNGK